MGYLILAFCVSAMVSVVMRLSEGKVTKSLGMLMVNYGVCTAAAAFDCGFLLLPSHPELTTALGLGAFNGTLYLAGFLLLRYNVTHNGVVLSSTFMKLGLLVSIVISMVFFGERPSIFQILGFVVAVSAILGMDYRSGNPFSGVRPELVALLLVGGLGDGMSKVFEEVGSADLSAQFLLYTFFSSLVMGSVIALFRGQLPGKWEWVYGVCVGIPNYYSCKFLLLALGSVPGVVAYPVYSVAGILLVTLAGVLLFRERLTRRQWMAIAAILLALVLLNV